LAMLYLEICQQIFVDGDTLQKAVSKRLPGARGLRTAKKRVLL
jgi:hypothetical protein